MARLVFWSLRLPRSVIRGAQLGPSRSNKHVEHFLISELCRYHPLICCVVGRRSSNTRRLNVDKEIDLVQRTLPARNYFDLSLHNRWPTPTIEEDIVQWEDKGG